jgi:hypothetical protein
MPTPQQMYERVLELLEAETPDDIGICLACGHEQDGCEPDARRVACEDCGVSRVYGAEEILIMAGKA